MAFNPSEVNRGGDYLFAGISGAGRAVGGGIGEAIGRYQQNKERYDNARSMFEAAAAQYEKRHGSERLPEVLGEFGNKLLNKDSKVGTSDYLAATQMLMMDSQQQFDPNVYAAEQRDKINKGLEWLMQRDQAVIQDGDRSYRSPLEPERALEALTAHFGADFQPAVEALQYYYNGGSGSFRNVELPDGSVLTVDSTGKPVGTPRKPTGDDRKDMTTTEIENVSAIQQSVNDIKMLEDYFSKNPNIGGPVAGRLKGIASMGGLSPEAVEIESMVNSTTPNLARGVFGEVGVLTDEDIRRYKALIPNFTDTAEQRKRKLSILKEKLKTNMRVKIDVMKRAGRDTSEIEKLLENLDAGNEQEESQSMTTSAGTPFTIRSK